MPENCEDLNLTPKQLKECKAYEGEFAKNKKVKKDKNANPGIPAGYTI